MKKINESLREYLNKLVEKNFLVLVPENLTGYQLTYAYFARGNRIGYVQVDDFSGFSFHSEHKPTLSMGNGFGMFSFVGKPYVSHAEDSLNPWSKWGQKALEVKQYASIEEFKKYNKGLINFMETEYYEKSKGDATN